MRQRRSYQSMKLEQIRDEARKQTPPRPASFDADLGRHNSRYGGGGMVANGLNKGSGALDDRAIRYQTGTQANYYPPPPTAEADGLGDLILGGGGTPTQALVFGVTDSFQEFIPGTGFTGIFGTTATRIYVKVGTGAPQQVLELDQERYIQLHQQAFGRTSKFFAGIINIQICSILSGNEFVILGEVSRDGGDTVSLAMYAALIRGGLLVQEQIFSAINVQPDDPETISWQGGLAAYADWLPTTKPQRSQTFPRGVLYEDVIQTNLLSKLNVDARARQTTIDPDGSILANKIPSSVVFPLQPFIEGATVPIETTEGESSLDLSFPIEDWATMGLEDLNIYGYIEDEFGGLEAIALNILYLNPSMASSSIGALGGTGNPGLILSPSSTPDGWRSQPFKVFTLARAVAIEV